jgi:hypothetical protein
MCSFFNPLSADSAAQKDAEARAVGLHQALQKDRVGNATPMIIFRQYILR